VKPGDPEWPAPKSDATTSIMRSTRGYDTAPQLAVRSLLHRAGLRFRVRYSIILGPRRWTRPDVVFTRARLAVYIDGCFWHGCPEHRTHPRNNSAYWAAKIEGNIARDADTDRRLDDLGWHVLRAWKHEDPASVAARIADAVHRLRRLL
jgi:DNA mismatch endonuclease, patch repair protein